MRLEDCEIRKVRVGVGRWWVAPILLGCACWWLIVSVPGAAAQARARGRLEEIVRFGDLDGPSALTRVSRVVLVDTLVFIAQPVDRSIRVISTRGQPVGEFGMKGDGPGEFQRIDFVGYVDGCIVVVDLQAGRTTYFGFDGGLINTERTPTPPARIPFAWFPIGITPGRYVIAEGSVGGVVDGDPRVPVVLATAHREVVDTLTWYSLRARGVSAHTETRHTGFPNPLHAEPRYAVSNNGKYFGEALGTGAELTVRWFDTTQRSWRERVLPLPGIEVPEAYSDSLRSVFHRVLSARGYTRSQIREAYILPSVVPAVDLIEVMSDGAVWMRQAEFPRGDWSTWHRMDQGGEEWLTIQAPRSLHIMDQQDDVIWGRLEDEFGVHYVVGLSVVRE